MVYKVMIFLTRRPGLSREAFRAYYEDHHVPLCMGFMVGVERYRRHYLEPGADGAEPPCDVITELAFASQKVRDAVLETLLRDGMPAEVIADEERLFDRAQSRAHAVDESETVLTA